MRARPHGAGQGGNCLCQHKLPNTNVPLAPALSTSYDEYVVYHNTTGSFDVSESRESVMDTGDFNAYEGLEPEYETAMTPFSDG